MNKLQFLRSAIESATLAHGKPAERRGSWLAAAVAGFRAARSIAPANNLLHPAREGDRPRWDRFKRARKTLGAAAARESLPSRERARPRRFQPVKTGNAEVELPEGSLGHRNGTNAQPVFDLLSRRPTGKVAGTSRNGTPGNDARATVAAVFTDRLRDSPANQ